MPRVSVVVSHYDRPVLLLEALDSIAAQTFRDFEILVVNDAGPDRGALLAAWSERSGVPAGYVHRAVNGGVAATRNSGVAAAGGELIAYLDDDDLWRPGHLAGLVGQLEAQPAADLAYGDAEVWRMVGAGAGAGGCLVAERRVLAVPFDAAALSRDDFIVPGAMLHRRTLWEVVGRFDESLFVSDDWDWLLRVHAARGRAAFTRLPEVVVTVRIFGAGHNLSASADPRRQAALDTLARRHGTPPLVPKTFWEVAATYAPQDGPVAAPAPYQVPPPTSIT